MSRWWDKYGFRLITVVLALTLALWVKQTQAAFLSEIYYFIVSPFESQQQITLEERLTNARILELEQRVIELEQQNQQLKQLLNYQEAQPAKNITASVIGRSRDRWWSKIILGKGSQENIQPGYVVVGIGGLVGRVVQVTPHTSQVLLISDTTNRVGAVLSRNRQLGYIKGNGSSTVVMRFFDRVTDIKPGDKVVTSTLSKLYPPGLPLGQVIPGENMDDTLEVKVELTAPVEILEWVTVLPFAPKIN
ncbi:rod shape-determining protein MreC [Pleurocapsales cyanobacterium LEGE 10410]|nr:rod shape-determining protein MreC [Pleurocapsales cyanobacterium LEGE 10410]